ncbi:MAG: single-stranded DNA-binding protein [Lentisphaeraceae bacterium]|nr:single-stranded DNA-binding protein [Lentisphaeraceae bacterium]
MAAYNKVILMGNLTRDPELRYTGSGTAVCSLGLAVNRTYKTQSGELREDPCFIDVTAWGKQAESCNNYLKKGAPVFIEGTLRFETWTDKTSGQNRSKHTISADAVRFLGAPQQGSGGFQDNPGQFSQQGQAPRPQSQPAQPQYSAPQSAPVQQPAQQQYQAPPVQPQAQPSPANHAQQNSSFEPPPMPDFEVESEDDIPF